jgi:ABC-type branched-subunit amino acid transport system substrate-binding protein
VVVGATDYTITHPAQTYIYRVASVVTNDVKADVNEGTKLGCKKAGLLTDNETVGQAYSQAITPLLPPGSVKQVFSSTATDLTSQMQALRSGGAQCIYAATVADATLGSMVRAMANTGFKVPVISDAATTSVSFIQAAGSAALAEVPSYGTSILNVNSAFYKSTYAAYVKKYGPLPQNEIGPAAFDAVNLIATGLKADNQATGSALATALQSITGSDYQSVTGVAGQSLGFSAAKHDWPGPDSSFLLKIEPNGDTQPTGVTAQG